MNESVKADFELTTLEDTATLATVLAEVLAAGDVVFLYGGLGAGKTTFVQYIARALDVPDDQYVSSPSFSLMHEYQGRVPVFHMDFYRLGDTEDVEAAGLLEYFYGQGVCLVEWPDRLDALPNGPRLDIFLEPGSNGKLVTLCGRGKSWSQRLERITANFARKVEE